MSDPPIKAMDDSRRWYESGPEAILKDPDLAVLMVRVGLAMNSLAAQYAFSTFAENRPAAVRMRIVLCALVTTAAFTNEAIKLASSEMKALRSLAKRAKVSDEVLEAIGQLCAGKHPVEALLKRSRNQLGFHWDDDIVRASVLEYGTNDGLVWLEWADDEEPVHRMAAEVLGHALLPEASQIGGEDAEAVVKSGLGDLVNATGLLTHFFSAAMYGYLSTIGAKPCTRASQTKE